MKNNSNTDTIIHLCVIAICVVSITQGLNVYVSSLGNYTISHSATGFINGSVFDYVSFNFTSETFGVQDDITVSIVATLDHNFVSKDPYSQSVSKLYVYLPNSYHKNPPVYVNGHYLSEPIELDKQNDGTFRNSLTTIQYEEDGAMCYILSAYPNFYSTPSCLPNADPIIHIRSFEAVNQIKANRNMEFLTWVILGFTVIIVGEPIINMKNHFSKYLKIPKPNSTDSQTESEESPETKSKYNQ